MAIGPNKLFDENLILSYVQNHLSEALEKGIVSLVGIPEEDRFLNPNEINMIQDLPLERLKNIIETRYKSNFLILEGLDSLVRISLNIDVNFANNLSETPSIVNEEI